MARSVVDQDEKTLSHLVVLSDELASIAMAFVVIDCENEECSLCGMRWSSMVYTVGTTGRYAWYPPDGYVDLSFG